MKKKLAILAIIIAVAASPGFSQQNTSGPEPLMAPGDLALTVGIGYGFFQGAIDVSGGIEYILGQFELGGEVPLTYGVAGRINYYRWNLGGDSHYTYLGGAGFGTLHLGLKEIGLDDTFLANVDTYIGLGIGLYNYSTDYLTSYSEFRMGLRSVGGFNYFITPNVAINFEGGYYGGWGGGLIAILVKL